MMIGEGSTSMQQLQNSLKMEDPEIGLLEQKILDLENELALSGDQFEKKVI